MGNSENDGSVILVPFDGSPLAEHALWYAAALATAGETILIVQILRGKDDWSGPAGESPIGAPSERSDRRQEALHEMARVATRITDARPDLKLASFVATGDPADHILQAAVERNADMIVMASRGRGALGRLAFGSVADRIARAAPIPVVIVRAPGDTSLPGDGLVRRLIVPLDGSDVAEAALPIAEQVARRLQLPILVVTVVDSVQVFTLPLDYASAFSQHVYESMLDDARSHAGEIVTTASARLRQHGFDVEEQRLTGPAATSLMDASREGDLMVMTSHGRGGFRRWLLGSVAEKLIREGPVPVMVVRSATSVAAPTVPQE